MEALKQSWMRAWSGLQLTGDGADLYGQLVAAYSEAHRKYHTLQHLSECVATLDSVRASIPHPAEVEIALWFHDAIYDTKRSDNEAQSAEWATTALSAAGSSADSTALV